MKNKLQILASVLAGELHFDSLMRSIYATDASVYRELPLAVAYPKDGEDIKKIIQFADENNTSIIPRTAGTSLAGQCVGDGIVVDVSKYMTAILELNVEEKWIRVQPGVIRDELNHFLKPHGLFFGPDTSTANRCMIGGMAGNNSCGTTSIKYGTTRDHVLALKTILSDGSEVEFKSILIEEFEEKIIGDKLENKIYRKIYEKLSDGKMADNIRSHFPKKEIHRRNTGYAVDALLEMRPFSGSGEAFNMCKLLCGSEGTLAFTTEIKLNLCPLPPKEKVIVCAHFSSLEEALKAVIISMEFNPYACELMDKIILDCTKENIAQQKNRFFIKDDPAAVLMVQFNAGELSNAIEQGDLMINKLKEKSYGYAFPKVTGPAINRVWELRKAGLGVLANLPGDAKAVACIEDTAVAIEDLPNYIADFSKIMKGFGQETVYYAHAGAGELHLRPILDLKKKKNVGLFRKISTASAKLIKKYNGSLSGEHGDGRVRAEFIPLMVGKENYDLFCEIKNTWDPRNIFNPGKITAAAPMDTSLRYKPDEETQEPETIFDFSATGGILKAAEKCNGSGDCRKLSLSGGTMCPSYRATRNEKDTTRARANALREFLTQNATDENPFAHAELKEVMDLCISCKGCASECPSNVDMATMKAEFLYQYQKQNGVPLRSKLIANIAGINKIGTIAPAIFNYFLKSEWSSTILKNVLGIAEQRNMPLLSKISLNKWMNKNISYPFNVPKAKGTVYLFCDEFTNYNDASIGIKTVQLLMGLGYTVKAINHPESGRAHISKGLLDVAKEIAKKNVAIFKDLISEETPLIGIEPSTIYSFRDEYPKLVDEANVDAAKELGKHAILIDDFLAIEIKKGNIAASQFSNKIQHILLHGHCHQKALADVSNSAFILSLPKNYTVEMIPSGCCGMAGSFGYEKEHYDVSMQIGELVLFPSINNARKNTLIAAPGTSCRHQILDGTKRKALHPVEILWDAFLSKK